MNSQQVKTFLQEIGFTDFRVSTIKATHNHVKYDWAIQVWHFTSEPTFRASALRLIYGDNLELNDQAIAGNVTGNSVTLSPANWIKLAEILKNSGYNFQKIGQGGGI